MKKYNKIIYYQDPLNDDFADNITKSYAIKDDYKYINKNPIKHLFGSFLYHFVAGPLFYLILKCKYHVRIYNKKEVKKLKKTGYFVYSNHTQDIIDAFIHNVFLFPTRFGHIIANNDVFSLKGIRWLIKILGTLPRPNDLIQGQNLYEAIKYYINKKHVIYILPEAHVWPYYNDIRPFLDTSFIFPASLNKPLIASTIVYRERKHRKNKHPYISIYVSCPIYPDINKPLKLRQLELRNKCYEEMKKACKDNNSFAYIKYIKEES